MTDLPPLADLDLFDEAGYLRLYPGIAEAIMGGVVGGALDHFLRHGRDEGRRPNDVDPAFYFASYPDVAGDLGRPPEAHDAAAHYVAIGRARGYRPSADAPRVSNGAAFGSPFGGLWMDQGNALDLIQGRSDLGRIRPREESLLRRFATEGFVELEPTFDNDKMAAAGLAVEQAFSGAFPGMAFAPAEPGAERWTWQPELTEQPVAALDPHMMSHAVRDVLLDRRVTDALALIFDAKPKLTASRASLRQPSAPDRDVAWAAYALPLQFVTVTFVLENSPENLASVWPGSHRLSDLPWSGSHICFSEALRAGEALARRENAVLNLVAGRDPQALMAVFGARTIRHANLVHTVRAPEPPSRWRSLTGWYCPSYGSPCYMEAGSARRHDHEGFAYSSGVYPAMDPLD